ncbi:MAG: peptidase S10 [Pseudomonadota bacterium]|nr:peptidase S10 [Pseudomonadota bacterium]
MPLRPYSRLFAFVLSTASLLLPGARLLAQEAPQTPQKAASANGSPPDHFQVEQQKSQSSVTVDGRMIDYEAVAGNLVVHPKDWDDVPQNADKDDKKGPPEASMFYVAYFGKDGKEGKPSSSRPITFLFNGGPGSSTVWLHMGAFGPRRVLTANDSHTPAAPYRIVNNGYSLLDASDLVFVDAPGAGFSRISGKDKEKAFYGIDADAQAFADFIPRFLSKYERWNSPKFLFGESYGTTRNAVLINLLESEKSIDFNGVINLSQILFFGGSPDGADISPGNDLPYELALPTYAATAWYHHALAPPERDLQSLLAEVQHYALNEYAVALQAGGSLDPAQRLVVANKLHDYIGLPVDYILKANLRITGGEFSKALQSTRDITVGRLDTRFSGPTIDPLSKEADYDPQSAALGSAYVAAFNQYARTELKYGRDKTFKPYVEVWKQWEFKHQPPGAPFPLPMTADVTSDLATAMKVNPRLKVMLNSGYFDLATPYFQGIYEMNHLPIPAALRSNIELHFYDSGHMVYANEPSFKALHSNVADFIRRASSTDDR